MLELRTINGHEIQNCQSHCRECPELRIDLKNGSNGKHQNSEFLGVENVDLPSKQKIGLKHFGSEKVKVERRAGILGLNFGRDFFFRGGADILGKQGRKSRGKTRHQNSRRYSPAIFLKFAKPRQTIHPNSALQHLGL